MKIKLWGVRGSLPSPSDNKEYRNKIRNILHKAVKTGLNDTSEINDFINGLPENLQYYYGGNTTCATVTSKSGSLYILDCGSGLLPLGNELLKGPCGKGKGHLKIFITHVHWDHIQGIPFFKPMYIPGNIMEFISPYEMLEKMRSGDRSSQNEVKFDQHKDNLGYGLLLKRYAPNVSDATDQQIKQAALIPFPTWQPCSGRFVSWLG